MGLVSLWRRFTDIRRGSSKTPDKDIEYVEGDVVSESAFSIMESNTPIFVAGDLFRSDVVANMSSTSLHTLDNLIRSGVVRYAVPKYSQSPVKKVSKRRMREIL